MNKKNKNYKKSIQIKYLKKELKLMRNLIHWLNICMISIKKKI